MSNWQIQFIRLALGSRYGRKLKVVANLDYMLDTSEPIDAQNRRAERGGGPMTDEHDLTKRQGVRVALMAETLTQGVDDAAILVICGNGSPGMGGAAGGLKPRISQRVSA